MYSLTHLSRFASSLVASSNSSAAGRFSRCCCLPSPKVGEPRKQDHGEVVLPAAAAVIAAAVAAAAAGVAEAGVGAEGIEEGKKEARLLVLVKRREANPEGSFMPKDGPQARKEAGAAAKEEEEEEDEEDDVSAGGAAAAAAVEVAVVVPPAPPPPAPPP